ncbi:C69 family dipeptidase [Candidatus Allofournierella merdipullorum]|uniref:C69 family dipeptidase n=1 Tax=Candidatus Allofournierella merdipullorum TaxID=2838595 RepID=UPI00374F4F4D
MCDTLGRIVNEGFALFAKNSDRSPNEPQVIEYRPAREHRETSLRATYLTIDQAARTYATLLSRPAWMWGAEMGVNDQGVCIGNEAVFTKGRYGRSGLTGMDLVRLALERAASARQARDLILELLERHGQGGDCGYDHSFFYDNAFLIMDRREIWLLETAGKKWVCRKVNVGSISNRLSLAGAEGERSPGAPADFTRLREPLYSHFSGSKQRLCQTAPLAAKAESAADMMAALRTHRAGADPLVKGDVASVCMHAGGLVGDHTTSSMVVELGEKTTVWLTGSSTPCLSLFLPWEFGTEPQAPVFPAGSAEEAVRWWRRREEFARAWVGRTPPPEFYAQRNALEHSWLALPAGAERARRAREEEEAFWSRWNGRAEEAGPRRGAGRFLRYWETKNRALAQPERPVVSGD